MNEQKVAGILLCGGQSSRMGRPKACLTFGRETMLSRMVRLLGQAVQPIVIVASPGQDLPPLPASVQIVCDEIPGKGPLHGVATGLMALRGMADAAFVSACDAPFLQPSFVVRMIDLLGSYSICVPNISGPQPLTAVYRVGVVDAIQDLLTDPRKGPIDLFSKVPTRFVDVDELRDVDPTLQSLRNVNTPEEYAQALRDLQI
jgi:molybdopterin-guanine dinucleotide biosynthesis protein A